MNTLQSKSRSGVFVSYARKDGEAFAQSLREKLESRQIPVWLDRTGMEGGRDWWEQIKEALNDVEFMVLVMTPAALQSEIVRKEWRYARQQGVCVYPVIADAGIDIGALPRWMSSVHWYDLKHQEARFFNDLNTRCDARRVPFMFDPLPADFVRRAGEFDKLKASLLSPNREEPVAITAALRGAGGYGKTTLARALCHDDDIQNAFDDGILWVTLGEKPTDAALIAKLGDLIETLSDMRPSFDGLDAAVTRFRELLADRDILLVIDDAWRPSDVRPFLSGGLRCARLITTRRADTLPPDAQKVTVDQMQAAEALALIGKRIPVGYEDALGKLAERMGEWPLLLKLANAMLRKRIVDQKQPVDKAFDSINLALDKRGVAAFDAKDAESRNDAVNKTLEISVDGLTEDDQARLLDLAVFDEDLNIPLHVLERYWQHTGQLDALDVEDTCQRLWDNSLLLEYSLEERFIKLHDAIRAWLISRPGDLSVKDRHCRLLESYLGNGTDWLQVADDGYLHGHLIGHLTASTNREEAEHLLLNFDWIKARLGAAGDVNTLLASYEYMADCNDTQLVRHALRMSSHVIAKHPDQVGFQLFGRLGASDSLAIRELCERGLRSSTSKNLIPIRPALTAPGPLVMTLSGHESRVGGAVLLDGGQRTLSWSDDKTLRLWDLQRGELLHTLSGHENFIYGAVLLDGGRQALSWSDDKTLRLWDLQRGELLHALNGHEGGVGGAVLLDGGRQALSWSDDKTLRLWDMQRGELLHALNGHEGGVGGAVLLDGGRQALSWCYDNTLRLWDLQRGELVQTLRGHEAAVKGVALHNGEQQALSWSDDMTLRLWDLQRGKLVHTLRGHEGSVEGATLCDGGKRAVSWSHGFQNSGDQTLRVWDLQRGELTHTLSGHELDVTGALLLDGQQQALSWSNDKTLRLWDLQSGELVHVLRDEQLVNGALLLDERHWALSWSLDQALRIWDLQNGKLVHVLRGHESSVEGALLLNGTQQVLSWSYDQTLRVWELRRDELLHTPSHDGPVNGAVLGDGGQQALSWSEDKTLRLWDLQRGELLRTLRGHENSVNGAVLLHNGQQALSWSERDNTLRLWELERGELLNVLSGHETGIRGALILDGDEQALSWSFDRTLRVWDLQRAELLHTLSGHQNSPRGAVLIAGGHQALSWSNDKTLRLWDLQCGKLLHTLSGHQSIVIGTVLVDDGQQALSWSDDETLLLWDLQRGELLNTLSGHQSKVYGAVPFSGGQRALSWHGDATLRLWDLQRGELLHTLNGHEGGVGGAVLLDGGQQALSWSEGKTLRLWDLQRCELLHTLSGHEDRVSGALLLDGGQQALSWSRDNTLRLWDLQRGELIASYFSSDAVLSCVVRAEATRKLLMGDALGRIHLIALRMQ